jgi:NIPSNAP
VTEHPPASPIYEIRTYLLKPGTRDEFERLFGEALVDRVKISPLGAYWHTTIGPLHQVIHVWPYESLAHRQECRSRALASGKWPARVQHLMLKRENEVMTPAPFMRELVPGTYGPVYEWRSYTTWTWKEGLFLERVGAGIAERQRLSPLIAYRRGEIGSQNHLVHVWAYHSLDERLRIRQEASLLETWPPDVREFLVAQETKILEPASFSPLK